MTYQFRTDVPRDEFDAFVHNSIQNTLYQESTWCEVKNNWDSYLTGIYEDGRLVGTGLVLVRHLFGPFTLFYLPRGPILDTDNLSQVEFYFSELKKLAKSHKAIVIRFDPALCSRRFPYEERNHQPERSYLNYIEFLKKLGIKHKGYTQSMEETTQPRFNAAKHVSKEYYDELDRRVRRCIVKSMEYGIEILEGKQYLPEFYQSIQYTEKRKAIALRNLSYFEHMVEVYGDRAICWIAVLNFPKKIKEIQSRLKEMEERFSTGELKKKEKNRLMEEISKTKMTIHSLQEHFEKEGKDQVVTCGMLGVYNKGLMDLLYMGNHPDYLLFRSSYRLYNEGLKRCVDLGIETCSFGGIEGSLDDGLTLFKSNWGMEVEEYIGEFDLVLNPILYYGFDQLYPKLRAFVAKRRGKVE